MKTDTCTVIIFTKAPVPGRVNTRLIPVLGEDGAAALYRELLRRTLNTAVAADIHPLRLYCTAGIDHPELVTLEHEFHIPRFPQTGRNLGERMENALHEALQEHAAAVLVGCDIPELSREDMETACRQLRGDCDAVIGPAEDGGFYLIGLSRPAPGLFHDMQWEHGNVIGELRRRLHERGRTVYELPEHWDVDRPRDLARYRECFETRINLAGKY